MSALETHLSNYAAYHQNKTNVATHILGIPIIVLAVTILTSRPIIIAGPVILAPSMLLALLAGLFYFRLDLRFGMAMAVCLALAVWCGLAVASGSTSSWLAIGLGAFLAGWVIQFIGHYYEGRKPAFLDDITGLLIGPLFVAAEIAILLGLRPDLRSAMHSPAQG